MESSSIIQEIIEYIRLALGNHYYVSRAALLGVIVSLFRHRKTLTLSKNNLLGLATGNLFLAIYASNHIAFWVGFPKAESLFAYLLAMYGMPICDVGLRFITRTAREVDVNQFLTTILNKFSNPQNTPKNEKDNQAGPVDPDVFSSDSDSSIP
jgi:hypothetical protein